MIQIMKPLFLLLFITIYPVHSQCSDTIKIPYSDGSFGDYIGCLDDFGIPTGMGLLKKDKYEKEGNWDSGNLNGQGKLTFLEDNSVYQGEWVNDELIKGNYSSKNDDFQVIYEGDFVDLKFQGNGVLEIIKSNSSIKKIGEFINNDLFTGESILVREDGLIINSKILKGIMVLEKRNDINYYNPKDITGNETFTTIPLKLNGSENEGISFLVEMEINGLKGEWIFDTGSELFSIGQRMFKRLVKEGLTYKDLNRNIKTFGIGGESTGRLIILDNLKIGSYSLKNVIVEIASDNNYSLMGISFLNKFSNAEWSMKKKQLRLYK